MKSACVCANCGCSVALWFGTTWKHQRGWHSPPSCGKPAVPILRDVYEACIAKKRRRRR